MLSILSLNSNGVGEYEGQKVDLRRLDKEMVTEILILVQMYTGLIYLGSFQDISQKVEYVLKHCPIDIMCDTKVESMDKREICTRVAREISELKRDIQTCEYNEENNTTCLTNLASKVARTQKNLLLCGYDENKRRDQLENTMEHALDKMVKREAARHRCETTICKKQAEIHRQLQLLEDMDPLHGYLD